MTQTLTYSSGSSRPTFGILLLGGPLSGAMIRDIRLANELVRRGYRVHVWWAMDRSRTARLDPQVEQHWLFHGLRYTGKLYWARQMIGQAFTAVCSDRRRADYLQTRPRRYENLMESLLHVVCDGVSGDPGLIRHLAKDFEQAGLTHVLSSLGMLGVWGNRVIAAMSHPVKHLVSFQGHELYLSHARQIGREMDLLARLKEVVGGATWPAVAVSEPYRQLLLSDLQLKEEALVTIPPGIPLAEPIAQNEALQILSPLFPGLKPDLPIVGFLGRQDADKGMDLLLYAGKILKERGMRFQIAIAGSSLFSKVYRHACRHIIANLDIPLVWTKEITGKPWSAFLSACHCLVYPSIIRETFGMVPVEAMAHGTPAVVPDYGGQATVITSGHRTGGVRFAPWDSGDLANQIQRLLTDETHYAQLAGQCRAVASDYSVTRMVDRLLAHMQITGTSASAGQ